MFRVFDKINNGEVYVIAEMSANHGGNLDTALKIVREAAKAGADCVKIQTYTADSITIDYLRRKRIKTLDDKIPELFLIYLGSFRWCPWPI